MNSEQFDTYSHFLAQDIELAVETENECLIKLIRTFWDNESWESIKSKFNTEDSTWIVWWNDGVNAYAKQAQ